MDGGKLKEKMGLTDSLVTLGILGILGFIIFIKLTKKHPDTVPKVKEWFGSKKDKIPKLPVEEFTQQIHEEKRTIM